MKAKRENTVGPAGPEFSAQLADDRKSAQTFATASDVLLGVTVGFAAVSTYFLLRSANFKAETPPNAEIDRAGAENILATVVPANASRNLDDYIDTSLTDQLRSEGFMAAIERKYRISR